MFYYTESLFTPCFDFGNCATTPPNSTIGLADTGTILLAHTAGLGAKAAFLSVPNQITAPGGTGYGEAYLIVGGRPVMSAGNTSLPVTNGTVDILYEVTAGDSYVLATLTIGATLLDVSGGATPIPAQAVFSGHLGPQSNVGTSSPTAPEPRFLP